MFDKALDITLNQAWVYAQIRFMWALIPIKYVTSGTHRTLQQNSSCIWKVHYI